VAGGEIEGLLKRPTLLFGDGCHRRVKDGRVAGMVLQIGIERLPEECFKPAPPSLHAVREIRPRIVGPVTPHQQGIVPDRIGVISL
jgi:hypothetical protein